MPSFYFDFVPQILIFVFSLQVLMILAGALLEKQIVFICSNLVKHIYFFFLRILHLPLYYLTCVCCLGKHIGNLSCISSIYCPYNPSFSVAEPFNAGIILFMSGISTYNNVGVTNS